MKSAIVLLILIFSTLLSVAQDTMQLLRAKYYMKNPSAVTYFNDAKESLHLKDTLSAIQFLKQAINTQESYSEPYVLLGEIYEEKGILDSALNYYYLAIDQAVEQDKEVYFALFRTSMQMGRYDIVKSNLKRYLAFHPEEEVTYYKNSIALAYDYKTWNSQYFRLLDTLTTNWLQFAFLSKKVLGVKENDLYSAKLKKQRIKNEKPLKKLSHNLNIAHVFVSQDENLLFFSGSEPDSDRTQIYMVKKEGKKWRDATLLPSSINMGNWTGTPYFSQKNQSLYFSSNPYGNKDLFVSKIDSTGNWSAPEALVELNSDGDEQSPYFNEDESSLYFASNGHAGLGGFDIFFTKSYETKNGIKFPFEYKNMGYPINSHHDDWYFNGNSISRIANGVNLIIQTY